MLQSVIAYRMEPEEKLRKPADLFRVALQLASAERVDFCDVLSRVLESRGW